MKFLKFVIIFVPFYFVFDWIIKKTGFQNKLFDKPRKYKNSRIIVIVLLLLSAFSIEYCRGLLNEKYGEHNNISTIIGAFLGAIYVNFATVIFRKSKT